MSPLIVPLLITASAKFKYTSANLNRGKSTSAQFPAGSSVFDGRRRCAVERDEITDERAAPFDDPQLGVRAWRERRAHGELGAVGGGDDLEGPLARSGGWRGRSARRRARNRPDETPRAELQRRTPKQPDAP